MSTRIHPKNVYENSPQKRLLVDTFDHEKLPKSVHEKSPFENVHEKSPILKKSVHEMSLSTKCLHPKVYINAVLMYFTKQYVVLSSEYFTVKFWF